jgi:outer membrane immunogenic protein
MLAGVAVAALASGAQAADLGVARGPVAGVIVAPVFNWTGFYVGAGIGYWTGLGRGDLPNAPPFIGSPNPNGIKVGGHIGYLHQFANNLVLGVEADLSWLGGSNREGLVPGAGGQGYRARGNWDGSVRGSVGFAVDRALIYGTAGVAFMNNSVCGFTVPGAACVAGTSSTATRAGWTVGAGLAYAVTTNVSVRAEYLYANYGTRSYAAPGAAGGLISYKQDTHTFRLGLSYHFTTGPSAIVARY